MIVDDGGLVVGLAQTSASPGVRWDLFAGVAVLATVALLAMARATQTMLTDPDEAVTDPDDAEPDPAPGGTATASPAPEPLDGSTFDAGTLLVNVAFSHGLLGGVLVAVAWYARIPASALGVAIDPGALPAGVGLGVALYLANEAAVRLTDWSGIEHSERLRELLAPATAGGWAALLFVVLPAIAVVEELLFRGALVGALAAGYGLPVWGLAAASSVLFGLGHGLQGPGGIVVTGLLGFVLAAAFVLTGSLLVVVVAHYLVNALEFVIHEGPRPGSSPHERSAGP